MGLRRFTDMSGGLSPQEFYKANSFPPGAECAHCHTHKVAVRAITFWPLKEALKDGVVSEEEVTSGAISPVVLQLNDNGTKKTFIRTSMAYACEQCSPAMEKVLAHDLPSYVVVDISRGPDPLNRVTVGRSQRHN